MHTHAKTTLPHINTNQQCTSTHQTVPPHPYITPHACCTHASPQGSQRQQSTQIAAAKAATIAEACGGIGYLCMGKNAQYGGSFAACNDFLSNNVTFGSWDNVDQNTVVCRQRHLLRAQFNPTVHCPHTGMEGGGVCVDKSVYTVLKDDFLTC